MYLITVYDKRLDSTEHNFCEIWVNTQWVNRIQKLGGCDFFKIFFGFLKGC